MADVFISYSRKDSDFGRQLYNALTILNRTVWMDWSEIPSTAEWWQEITAGIELSDNFVFLISADSLASPICNLELEYARTLNKRIVPVLLRETDEQQAHVQLIHKPLNDFQRTLLQDRELLIIAHDNWQQLAGIHFVIYESDTNFDEWVTTLVAAINVDIEYVHEHTRLLNRANDWDRRGRLPSLLLRGDDLTTAETWLDSSATREPKPTDIHHQFIDASRQFEDEQKRQAEEIERRTRALEVQTEAAAVENQRLSKRTRQFRRWIVALAITGVTAIIATVVASLNAMTMSNSASEAQTRAAEAGQTLTVVPETLIPLNTTLQAGSTQLAVFPTQIAQANITLEAVRDDAVYQRTVVESQRLAAEANQISQEQNPDFELAALLSIRALRTTYSPQADFELARAMIHLEYLQQVLREFPSNMVGVTFLLSDPQHILVAYEDGNIDKWNIPTGQSQRIFSFGEETQSVRFSPDGQLVLGMNSTRDNTLAQLWHIERGQQIGDFEFQDHPYTITFSPDGEHILTGYYEGIVQLWSVETREPVLDLSVSYALEVALFSPDSQFVLTASRNDGLAQLWSIETGELVWVYTFSEPIQDILFSPDSRSLLHTYYDGQSPRITFLDLESSSPFRSWVMRPEVLTIALSPDGGLLLTGHGRDVSSILPSTGSLPITGPEQFDNTAYLWDATLGRELRAFRGHTDGVESVRFSLDGCSGLTTSYDGTIRLWNTGSDIETCPATGRVYYANFLTSTVVTPDGKHILVDGYDRAVSRVHIETGQQQVTMLEGAEDQIISFSPDGRYVLIGSNNQESAALWEIETGSLVASFPTGVSDGGWYARFSPDSRYVVTGYSEGTLKVWDTATGLAVHTLAAEVRVRDFEFSPDTQYVLVSYEDNTGQLWDLEAGHVVYGLDNVGHRMRFTDEGRQVLIITGDGTGQLRDVGTGELLQTFPFVYHYDIVFSHDGLHMLSLDPVMGLKGELWDTTTGTLIHTFLASDSGSIGGIAFSPDNRFVVTGHADSTIHLWDVQTGAPVKTLTADVAGRITTLEFLEDSSFLLTGHDDGTVHLWNIETGELLRNVYTGHLAASETTTAGGVGGLMFAGSGASFVTMGSNDNRLRLWDTDYRDFIDYACRRVFRDLTASERQRFNIADNEPTCP